MNVFYIILAAAPVLLLGAVAFFVLIVVGVRNADRGDLASPPKDLADRVTRRIVGGAVHIDNDGGEN